MTLFEEIVNAERAALSANWAQTKERLTDIVRSRAKAGHASMQIEVLNAKSEAAVVHWATGQELRVKQIVLGFGGHAVLVSWGFDAAFLGDVTATVMPDGSLKMPGQNNKAT